MRFKFNLFSSYGGFDLPRKFDNNNMDATSAALINAAASTANGLIAISSSKSENRRNRRFQAEQNELARQYATDMWEKTNAYNSPSAQRARLLEAGLNPYLADAAVQSPTATPPATPSHSAIPNSSPTGFDLVGQGIGSFGSFLQLSANAANQRAQSISTIYATATQIMKTAGVDAAQEFLKKQAPFLKSQGMADSIQMRMWNSEVATMEFNQRIAGVKASLEEKYGEEKAQREIWAMDQAYEESVSRVGLNSALGKVYNASEQELIERAKTYASQIALNYAQAFHWQEKGLTEQQIRQYLVSHWDYTVRMLKMDYDESEAEWSMNEGVRVAKHTKEWKSMRRGTTEWKESRTKQFTDEVRTSLQSVPLNPPRAAQKRSQLSWKQRDYYSGGYVEQYGYTE